MCIFRFILHRAQFYICRYIYNPSVMYFRVGRILTFFFQNACLCVNHKKYYRKNNIFLLIFVVFVTIYIYVKKSCDRAIRNGLFDHQQTLFIAVKINSIHPKSTCIVIIRTRNTPIASYALLVVFFYVFFKYIPTHVARRLDMNNLTLMLDWLLR